MGINGYRAAKQKQSVKETLGESYNTKKFGRKNKGNDYDKHKYIPPLETKIELDTFGGSVTTDDANAGSMGNKGRNIAGNKGNKSTTRSFSRGCSSCGRGRSKK